MHQTPLLRLPNGESVSLHLGLASARCQLWASQAFWQWEAGPDGRGMQDPSTTASWLPRQLLQLKAGWQDAVGQVGVGSS